MVDYRIPGYGEQFEWDYPPIEEDPYLNIPVPQDLYTTRRPDPLNPPTSTLGTPAGGPVTRARVGQEASGLFTGPSSFAGTMYETAKALPETVARAVDFPAAALRGEVDPLSDEGIGRAMDAAGTVTLGGGAIPRAAPRNSLRAGYARPMDPDAEHITSAAIYGPDGNIYAGRMHWEIGETLPPDVAKKFWDDYRPEREGFVTSSGRFVTREEADRIAREAGQIEDTLTGQRSLSSEDLMAHSWGGDDDDMLSANRNKTTGAIPLAMDRESRMARAAENYPELGYHGTTSDISAFDRPTWVTDDPAVAGYYSDRAALRDAMDRKEWDFMEERPDIDEVDPRFIEDLDVGDLEGQNVMPLRYNPGKNLDMTELGDAPSLRKLTDWLHEKGIIKEAVSDEDLMDWEADIFMGEDGGQPTLWKMIEDLDLGRDIKQAGYDSLSIEDVVSTRIGNQGHRSTMIIDPAGKIRSTAAAFDPKKSDSADILAANRSATAGAVPIFSRMEREAQALSQPRAQGQQLLSTMKNKGVPQEELDWTGVADWLKERGPLPVTKDELLAQIGQRQTQVGVKKLGPGDPSDGSIPVGRPRTDYIPTKYQQYQLPGGENYREVLLTLPTEKGGAPKVVQDREGWKLEWPNGEPVMSSSTNTQVRYWDEADARQAARSYGRHDQGGFVSSHWDEPNVLAHMRVNDRVLPLEDVSITDPNLLRLSKVYTKPGDVPRAIKLGRISPEEGAKIEAAQRGGQRVLFAEEIQSDWHKKGRREGYKVDITPEAIERRARELVKESNVVWEDLPEKSRNIILVTAEQNLRSGTVPNAPFKKSWPDLTLKRLVADAIEGGYDAVAWTDGATQAARYDLSKQVSSVEYNPKSQVFSAYPPGVNRQTGNPVIHERVPPDKLADYIGKDPADKLLNNPTRVDNGLNILSGVDLQVGGEGMKAFYDVELPRRAKKLFGKYGATVEDANLPAKADRYEDAIKYLMDNEEHHPDLPRDRNLWKREPEEDIILAAEELGWKPNNGPPIHILRITPEMRAKIQSEGLPLFANRSKAAGAVATEGDESPINQPRTGGRFASGGGVRVEVNGRTYTGPKKSLKGRPLSKNIEDRRGSQVDDVNRRNKGDRLPSALESLVAPDDSLYMPEPGGDELMSPTPLGDGPPQTMEEIILRQGGDQFISGLVEDPTPGRTDRLPTSMPADSYVIPADIVSGMGQGNTLAGAKILDAIFRGHAAPPSKAEGGGVGTGRRIPVIVAGGEYVVPPDRVRSIGGGDPTKGHKNLDSFVRRNRAKLVRRLKTLDGPRTD